jgi:Mn-dependent DtxR family transcriptional regulator
MTDTDTLMAVIRVLKERHPDKRSPTLQEIADYMGISRQAAHQRTKVAERRGFLEIIPRKHRGIILL